MGTRRGKLRNQFTDLQLRAAYAEAEGSCRRAAKLIGVAPRTFQYWWKQLENGDTKTNSQIRHEVKLREPSMYDDEVIDPYHIDTSCIMVIPDLHCPYHHPKAFDFLQRVRDQYQPTLVICLGDELDYHAISFHDSDPALNAAGRELELGRQCMKDLHKIFPQLQICHSNHGSLVYRRAKAHGLPVQMIRSYREIIFPNGKGRQWSWHHRIHHTLPNGKPIVFRHNAPGNLLNAAAHEHASMVIGHQHGKFNIAYASGENSHFFAVTAGCLIDKESMAFAYGMENRNQAVLGCVVIKDSVPRLIPM